LNVRRARREPRGDGRYHSASDFRSFDHGAGCLYSFLMAVKAIQPGQIWRHDDTGKTYLVTKVYKEALAQYAMLRAADSSTSSESVRVHVKKTTDGATLPGYTFAQDGQEF